MLNAGRANGMSDGYYIASAFFIGTAVGMVLCCLIEWVTKNYRPKKERNSKNCTTSNRSV